MGSSEGGGGKGMGDALTEKLVYREPLEVCVQPRILCMQGSNFYTGLKTPRMEVSLYQSL